MDSKFPESTDRDSYETGSTKPPKSRSGLIAFLLVAVIFLGGLATAMGVMNIRMFQKLNQPKDDSAMSFTDGDGLQKFPWEDETHTAVTAPAGQNVTLPLEKLPEPVENIPQPGGLSLQQIYAEAIDSVVSVTSVWDGGAATGTGVVMTAEGYIVTNCHVIQNAKAVTVRFNDERELDAGVVGADEVSDIAVLYVQAEGLKPARFGNSDALRVGDAVAAIGDPLGTDFRGTMTDGIVSAINRDIISNGRVMTLIQTNAALNSGNSGGPLLNCFGQVIGINTMKIGAFADEAGVEGLGFAIPSTTVKEVAEELIRQGYVSGRPAMGITGSGVSAFDQRFYRLPAGFLVKKVMENGAAAEAGMATGDIILTVDDERVTSAEELSRVLNSYNVGDRVELLVYRYHDAKQYKLQVTLGEARG